MTLTKGEFGTSSRGQAGRLMKLYSDIDGQIARCHERIKENIMPAVFRQRLLEYETRKDLQL